MEDNILSDTNNADQDQQNNSANETESEPEILQQLDAVPVPQPQQTNTILLEVCAIDHSDEEHPQVDHHDVEPEQGPSHQVDNGKNLPNSHHKQPVKERRLFRSTPVTQNMKPKQLAIKNTAIRKSKRLAIVKSRKIIKAIAAKLNQNTSSDTESLTSENDSLEGNTSIEKEENDDNNSSGWYEGDDEEEDIDYKIKEEENYDDNGDESYERDEEDDNHDKITGEVQNTIRQLDGGITPDSLTPTSNRSLDSQWIRITLEALDLNKPGVINIQNNVSTTNLARSRIMSTSEGQLSQHSNPNHRPSIWRRRLMRLRNFLDRLYKK